MTRLQLGTHPCGCERRHPDTTRVALTGGPGAGKTAILEMALRQLCPHVAALPESAGIIFGGGFPRRGTTTARVAAQRAIFHVQRELERLVDDEDIGLALCDRATIDGFAYWPDEAGSFWESFGTTREAELARYDAVIHLRTPTPEHGYNHDNVLRIESAAEARAIDDRILAVWEGHPQRVVVDTTDDFLEKARAAVEAIEKYVPSCCHGSLPPPKP
jgi:predicted ATPase